MAPGGAWSAKCEADAPRLGLGDLARMGLKGLTARNVRPFAERQAGYLDWRRRWVFLSQGPQNKTDRRFRRSVGRSKVSRRP